LALGICDRSEPLHSNGKLDDELPPLTILSLDLPVLSVGLDINRTSIVTWTFKTRLPTPVIRSLSRQTDPRSKMRSFLFRYLVGNYFDQPKQVSEYAHEINSAGV